MSVAACAELVRRGDPGRFRAAMTAPQEARARLFPLYAFNLEIARAPWVASEPEIGAMRLTFWREVLAGIEAGEAPRAHEVAAPFADVVREAGLPVDLLDAMVVARWTDLARARFESPDALGAYLDETAGSLMWAAVLALGGGKEKAVRAAGRAAGLAAWLMAVPELEARGWPALPDGIEGLIADARAGLDAARRENFGAALPALRTGWRAGAVLRRAARDPGAIRAGRLAGPEIAARLGLITKTLAGRW